MVMDNDIMLEFQKYERECLARNQCPHSGLSGPECKSWLCDCFDYEDLWGVSQK
jgi:hypothetical protein